MKPEQQQVLFENTGRALAGASREVQIRHTKNCVKADPAYGEGLAEALGILILVPIHAGIRSYS
jgi:catalase